MSELKIRGAAVIRNVVSEDETRNWRRELDEYLADNPHTKAPSPENPDLYELFWSPAQLKARAHPNLLTAHRFLLRGCWHHHTGSGGGGDSRARMSLNFPVMYADRLRILHSDNGSDSETGPEKFESPVSSSSTSTNSAHVDGGSVERWEEDGYGGRSQDGTYRQIWSGDWEDYDPWDGSPRLSVTSDLYNSVSRCSVFRMFQGMLTLSVTDDFAPPPPVHLCPLPLRLTTAYWLLRPFFSPKIPLANKTTDLDGFLASSNWTVDTIQTPTLHGAEPCQAQELNAMLHPHLRLDETLIPLPPTRPGDYVIWHPDVVHSTTSPMPSRSTDGRRNKVYGGCASDSTFLYIPACPLTQNNALFLARQRRAFLLGFPGPDFTFTYPGNDVGESYHMGRPGVQEVNETGGEEALQTMGLLEWDEKDAVDFGEKRLLWLANAILFPDRHEMRQTCKNEA